MLNAYMKVTTHSRGRVYWILSGGDIQGQRYAFETDGVMRFTDNGKEVSEAFLEAMEEHKAVVTAKIYRLPPHDKGLT